MAGALYRLNSFIFAYQTEIMALLRKYFSLLAMVALVQLMDVRLYSQEIPHPVNNTGIYEFLDELANGKLIEISSLVKPYSRLFIAQKLNEADGKRESLNKRQQKELDFYEPRTGDPVSQLHRGRNIQPAASSGNPLSRQDGTFGYVLHAYACSHS